MPDSLGLYLHIPFCAKKCAYCDFYSTFADENLIENYLSALITEIEKWGGKTNRPIDSIYIGGGTPSLLAEKIIPLLDSVYKSFHIESDCEITAEINPSGNSLPFLEAAKEAKINRLSIGIQSVLSDELKLLGRTHSADDAVKTVTAAKALGFDNISLDLIICLPDSNVSSLEKSLDFLCALSPQHISSYILKVEPNTKFAHQALLLPDEDTQAEQYLYMCEYLEARGYEHYEISNFAKNGKRSRHNMKYWTLKDYIGIGPSAHSFFNGKRFFYPKNLKEFLNLPKTVFEETTYGIDERLMLECRLKEGICIYDYCTELSKQLQLSLEKMKNAGLINFNPPHLSLTNSGMLVSNSIITEIMELLYENL